MPYSPGRSWLVMHFPHNSLSLLLLATLKFLLSSLLDSLLCKSVMAPTDRLNHIAGMYHLIQDTALRYICSHDDWVYLYTLHCPISASKPWLVGHCRDTRLPIGDRLLSLVAGTRDAHLAGQDLILDLYRVREIILESLSLVSLFRKTSWPRIWPTANEFCSISSQEWIGRPECSWFGVDQLWSMTRIFMSQLCLTNDCLFNAEPINQECAICDTETELWTTG